MSEPLHLWSGMLRGCVRVRTVARLVMLVLSLFGLPGLTVSAHQATHCRDGMAAGHSSQAAISGHHASGPVTSRWTTNSNHECPHCPPSECIRTAACGGTATLALSASGHLVKTLPTHGVIPVRGADRATSANSPPDTPPPQSIS
jgi:hypothetical protein